MVKEIVKIIRHQLRNMSSDLQGVVVLIFTLCIRCNHQQETISSRSSVRVEVEPRCATSMGM